MAKIDPLYKLYNYACDKMYRVIYKVNDSYLDEHVVIGMLLNINSHFIVLLGERGIYYIRHKDVKLMEPIPMPRNLCDNYRSVIETYLKEEAEFRRI